MDDNETLVTLTADIVAAHVSNNSVAISDIPLVIRSVHEALSALGATAVPEVKQEPAVSIRSSVQPDYIVCLEADRKSVVKGKSVSVRVDPGGRRIVKKIKSRQLQ